MMNDPSFLYLSTVLPPILLGIIIWKSDRFQEPGKYLLASFLLGVSIILPLDLEKQLHHEMQFEAQVHLVQYHLQKRSPNY